MLSIKRQNGNVLVQLLHRVMLIVLLTLAMNTVCKGQLTLRFTEQDYASSANSSSVHVKITKTGNNADNITIRIFPFTFASYYQHQIVPCVDDVVQQFNSYNPAEEDDFDSTVLEQIIPPSQTGISTTYTFNVSLRPDNVLEGDEAFVIVLNITSENMNDVVESSRRCAIIRIREPSFTGPIVNFVRNGVVLSPNTADPLMLPEDTGVEMLLTVVKVIDTDLPIRVTVTTRVTNSVSEGSDFTVPIKSVDISPEESSTNITINIIDDGFAEARETFTVSVQASVVGHIIFSRQDIEVEVIDNEVVTVGIKNSEDVITITEGESTTITVGLVNFETKNYMRYTVALIVTTVDGTAIVGQDYNKSMSLFRPFMPEHHSIISTIKRAGIEPARHLTFGFVSDLPQMRFERQNITIIITDSSTVPLAPSISNLFIMKDSVIETSWTQDIDDDHPIDNFIIIIKACSSTPCVIKDPQMSKDDENEFQVNKNVLMHQKTDVDPSKVYVVVVCATNSLGRNCSAPRVIDIDPVTQFEIVPPHQIVTPATTTFPTLTVGIVLLLVLLILLCILIIPLIFFFIRKDREKAYWPEKSMEKKLEGKSMDSFEESISEMKYL